MEFLKKLLETILQALFGKLPAEPTPLAMPAIESTGASFDVAAAYTLKDEGGYSNSPKDKGGPTNKGITQADLTRYLGHQASIDEVKNLTTETANKIYKKSYWDVMNLDNCIDQNIANCIFDIGILCGTGIGARFTQEICGVKVDLKIGKDTLAALNSISRQTFVPQFVQKTKDRFNSIVAKNPSQKVFLDGWNARADRLMAFANPHDVPVKSPTTTKPENIGAGLIDLAAENKLNVSRLQEMIDLQAKIASTSNPRYWALFDIGKHSKNKRMAIIDRIDKTVTLFYVAHGKNSDPDYDGLATIFSNANGSNCSSVGIYSCAETYNMAGHGRALRLDGMSPTNSNARVRGVVMHGALGYVSDDFVLKNGKCGRSLGCPAMDPTKVQAVIDKLRNGSLLYIHN